LVKAQLVEINHISIFKERFLLSKLLGGRGGHAAPTQLVSANYRECSIIWYHNTGRRLFSVVTMHTFDGKMNRISTTKTTFALLRALKMSSSA